MGGVLGGMAAFGGAIEHQGNGTPHLHAEGHVFCAYQFDTLADIAKKLREHMMSVDDVKQYQSWLHCEDVLEEASYNAFRPRVAQTRGGRGDKL